MRFVDLIRLGSYVLKKNNRKQLYNMKYLITYSLKLQQFIKLSDRHSTVENFEQYENLHRSTILFAFPVFFASAS